VPRDTRLLFGLAALVVFTVGVLVLPWFVPDYDSVRQTVSELGEVTSPMRWPFCALLGLVAACLLVFAAVLRQVAHAAGHNAASAWLTAWMAVAAAAIGYFAFPHPLHNVFGQSELVGYQAPLAFALAWRRDRGARTAVLFSYAMFALVWVSLLLNLTVIVRDGAVWHAIRPVYGLVQRSLFVCFFAWSAGVGWLLWRSPPSRA
jgi:hypothetical membrane protein